MDIHELIHCRRSIKSFTDAPVTREQIETLLESVCQAPNHRMTEPWRFYVLGPESRYGYGEALGKRKAKKVEDPEAAQAVIEKVATTHRALPAMLAVAITQDESPEIREEDYAAAYMGLQNLSLAACAMGLGTHIKSGAIMDDPNARTVVGLPEGERIIAIVNVGVPESTPDAKARRGAAEFTTWVE